MTNGTSFHIVAVNVSALEIVVFINQSSIMSLRTFSSMH